MRHTPKPITREDMYYSYIINGNGGLPTPITRRDMYLYYLCVNGFGMGGEITPEMIENAVNNYLEEHPIEVPTMTSQLINDSGYIVSELETQENMVKFLNGEAER